MTRSHQRRLWVVLIALIFAAMIIVGRLFAFQMFQGEAWAERAGNEFLVQAQPERGVIYDRNGAVLAANGADYQVSISPNLVTEPEELATALSSILEEPRFEVLAALESDQPYQILAGRVSAQVAELVMNLPYSGVQVDPLPRRFYPQGELMCHTLGYVDFDGDGGAGLEGHYQGELAGEAATATLNISPLTVQESVIARKGADLVLTVDRTVQYTVEKILARGMGEYGARSGSIIVVDPRTGAILAMASLPCYEPYTFYEAEEERLLSPVVGQQYEPGSVIKLLTMAAALDSGAATPQSTYYDAGVLEVGGHRTVNWDRSAPGTTDMSTLLSRSLNVGAATLALWMGPDTFYDYYRQFGFGRPTGVDLMSEAAGAMHLPGSESWTESFLATNAYGQGVAVTPLQMATAVSALANEGYLMQPYLVDEIRTDQGVHEHQPTVASRPISPETAHQVTAMAVAAVAREVPEAQVPGYTIAGKTGTAEIAENGVYHPTDTIASFIGWLPADAPEIVVLVKLDRPSVSPWGSETAAPLFAELVEELVVLLDIPPDNVRLQADVMAARDEK